MIVCCHQVDKCSIYIYTKPQIKMQATWIIRCSRNNPTTPTPTFNGIKRYEYKRIKGDLFQCGTNLLELRIVRLLQQIQQQQQQYLSSTTTYTKGDHHEVPPQQASIPIQWERPNAPTTAATAGPPLVANQRTRLPDNRLGVNQYEIK